MNKQQIIAPLVAMGIVAAFGLISFTRNQTRGFLLARANAVGYQLIKSTNSTDLVSIGPDLRDRLAEFLASPATVEAIQLGDEPKPIGDGQASARLFLRNEKQDRLALRLRPDDASAKLHVVGYWTPRAAPH